MFGTELIGVGIESSNNHIHSDIKKLRSFLALLFAAGDVRRWAHNAGFLIMRINKTSVLVIVLLMTTYSSFAQSSNVTGWRIAKASELIVLNDINHTRSIVLAGGISHEQMKNKQDTTKEKYTELPESNGRPVDNKNNEKPIQKKCCCESVINSQFMTELLNKQEASTKEGIQKTKDGLAQKINSMEFKPQKKENGYSTALANVVFMFLGVIISLYGTIVFDRFKRFSELLRTVGEARQLYEGYPTSIDESELSRAHGRAMDYWRLLESKQWVLNSDHHYKAAAKLDILKNFAYRSIACIENMQNNETKGLALDQYLAAFQVAYSKINRDNFIQYKKTIKPNVWALLKPFPHPVLPTKATTVTVDYFENLL